MAKKKNAAPKQAKAPKQNKQNNKKQQAVPVNGNPNAYQKLPRRALRKKTYETWLADKILGGTFSDQVTVTRGDTMTPNFAFIESYSFLSKFFMITKYDNYVQPNFLDELRVRALDVGLKINYWQLGEPHVIDWSSSEMRNRIAAWRRYTEDAGQGVNVWDYRESKKEQEQKQKLIDSTLYLNEEELVYQRTLSKVTIIIQLICDKDQEGIISGNRAATELVRQAKIMGINLKPIKMNMGDWLKYISQFSRRRGKALNDAVAANVMTDDIIANMAGYKQGRIGNKGIPLGLDIHRREAVLYKFKSDPNKPENWLISAITGGGKSYFIKSLLIWLLGSGLTVTILDYEGDEYTELHKIMSDCDKNSSVIVSMGKGSAMYVEPLEIPDLVGDPEIDDDLKDSAIEFAMAMFRIMVHGTEGELTRWEEGVLNRAIANVYAEHRVTNDQATWVRSKGITLRDVYEEVVRIVDSKELFDDLSDNVQHKAAVECAEAMRPYFDEEGARASAFKNPLSLTDLRDAQLIIFSFGVKGAVASSTDKTILALKQLCVANISTQISNYCKYVKRTFNVKVWEEFQRYIEVKGSAEVIGNSLTGGRKRGDINFVVTNDLQNILDDTNNVIMKQIRQSITAYAIGKIRDSDTVEMFCEKFKMAEVKDELMKLAIANNTGAEKRYNKAFCLMLDDGKKAIVKAMLPKQLAQNPLFSTGVKVQQ